MERLETLILDRGLIERTRDLKIVYTPIHGTGGVIVKPMLRKIGLNFSVVPEQDQFDGRFPTVKSPNPENAEALNLGISLAQKQNADLVIATDPDCDRMGVAVRTSSGEMKLLSGNQIGSLLAWYRAKTFFDRGILNKENAGRGVIIKTFVTSDLQKAIAEKFGLRCVDTLTGFKYNGAKLKKYEELTRAQNYRELSEEETRRLRLEKSSFYIFGGEESYGYSAADFVRDKDGNAAVIMFCEVAAYAKSKRADVGRIARRDFLRIRLLRGKESLHLFRGCGWCGEDSPAAHFLRRKSTAPDAGQCGNAHPEFREGHDSRQRRRRDSKREDVDFRVGGQDSDCGSRLGNRTQNQVLPLWGAIAGEWKIIARGIGASERPKSATGWMRYGVGCKKTRISALPNNSLDTARFAVRIATWDTKFS